MTPNEVNTPAHVPSGQVADLANTYPVPRHLTPGGSVAFRSEVARFALGLGAELEKHEVEIRSRGAEPEHTAESVERAKQAHLQRLLAEHAAGQQRARRDRAVLATILITAATVGVNVMQNFLHDDWQFVLFAVFVLAGVAGLGLLWSGRIGRSGGAGDP